MTERWRLLRHWGFEPGLDMAVDEALLESACPLPTLRLYTFDPPALSLGWFQRAADVPALARARAAVRRQTGGGAIHHARELTFSIAAPLAHPLYAGAVAASYDRVHAALAAALAELGVDARPRGRGGEPLLSDRPGTGMCFHASTAQDLVWGRRKGVGSAQRRRGGRVVHHGSVKLGPDPLEPGVATVEAAAGPVELGDVAAVVERVLARAFGADLEPGELTHEEEQRARSRAAHFRSAELVRRR